MLHLTGVRAVNPKYETLGTPSVTLEDVKRVRQLDSKCPGHPEYRWTSGVETTTRPLGQGVATSVGMAIAERWLASYFNRPGFELFDEAREQLEAEGVRARVVSMPSWELFERYCRDHPEYRQQVLPDPVRARVSVEQGATLGWARYVGRHGHSIGMESERREPTMNSDIESAARALVADGKGILAADETPGTLTKRFAALGILSTEQTRRTYREMLFTAPDVATFISGAIMQDETIRQKSSTGIPLPEVLASQGIVPGIKVDTGAKPLALAPGETITEGLDGLRDRLAEYRGLGARFAKWRAVIHIGDALPSRACVNANADSLARYAALCQDAGVIPIVEPEVLMDGSHSIERCEEVTAMVLHAVFHALFEQRISLESMLLKPNMVVPGTASSRPASVEEVATATLRCLRRHVPAAVPGIVFLSGGQSDRLATAHLDAINRLPEPKPWKISFSYGRALQDAALEAWRGRDENLKTAQAAFSHRARCNGAASLGQYTEAMEAPPAAAAGSGSS